MSLEKTKEERPGGGWRWQVRWGGYLVLAAVFTAAVAIGLWRSGILVVRGGPSLSPAKAGIDPSYALYVGDRVCSDCHPGEVALHSRSGHSRTLRPAGRFVWTRELDGLTTEDPDARASSGNTSNEMASFGPSERKTGRSSDS